MADGLCGGVDGQEERRHAEAQSALVNEAYSVLKSPLKRAKYLVKLPLDLPGIMHQCFPDDPPQK